MVHDYPLEELSPRAFEQLAVALALKVLGPGVEAYGPGADGGREATYTGPVNWSATSGLGVGTWDGYTVIQAKQREFPGSPQDNAAWLREQIDRELNAWTRKESKRGQFPQYLIIVTNVRLSSVPGSGGIDSINEYMHKRVHGAETGSARPGILGPETGADHMSSTPAEDTLGTRGLRDWRIWHRDQLNALLTVEDGIRRAFPAMLTAGDVMERLGTLSEVIDPGELQPVLTAHARNTLLTERWLNLSEAGDASRQSVEEVIIDLGADGPDGREATALSEIISRGDAVLKASMTPEGHQRHMVITGSPGNGKSTISRFVTQAYRSEFMATDCRGGTAKDVIEATRAALSRLGLHPPRNRRWPLRVDLAELADSLKPSGGKSLLRWLSDKVSLRAEIDLKPATLKRWLRAWPWLLVLDGLDEVTSLEVRRRIVDEIQSLIETADEEDADLLVIVTTRPTGYTEAIAPAHFAQYDLRYLDGETAARYGRLVTSRRLADDLDRRDQVLTRFEKHLADPAMGRLMKTPLQVLIMSVILERVGNLPPDRYQLFWRYYETVYDREAAKDTTLAPLLTQHRRSITELHEAVGLTLQVRSEASGDSRALLSQPDLYALVEARLLELGHEPGTDTRTLAENMVVAATKRLVLLVPAEDDTVTFEVRSLQELMAGRAISNGTYEEIRERLYLTARSPHWRNTWVFAAGRTFAESADRRRDLIVSITETIDKQPGWPSWLCPVGPELAADLLDDGLAAATPKWQRRLIDVALRALSGPAPRDPRSFAWGLTAGASGNNELHIRNALKEALAGTPRSRAIARIVADAGHFRPPIRGGRPRKGDVNPSSRAKMTTMADLLSPQLAGVSQSPGTMHKVEQALAELAKMTVLLTSSRVFPEAAGSGKDRWARTLEALQDQDASLVLELLCGGLDANLWYVQEGLAETVWPWLSRTPVGSRLNCGAQV